MTEETKVGLAESNKWSYYRNWSDDSDSRAIESSWQKIESRKEKGSVKSGELESDNSDVDGDSSGESDTDARIVGLIE